MKKSKKILKADLSKSVNSLKIYIDEVITIYSELDEIENEIGALIDKIIKSYLGDNLLAYGDNIFLHGIVSRRAKSIINYYNGKFTGINNILKLSDEKVTLVLKNLNKPFVAHKKDELIKIANALAFSAESIFFRFSNNQHVYNNIDQRLEKDINKFYLYIESTDNFEDIELLFDLIALLDEYRVKLRQTIEKITQHIKSSDLKLINILILDIKKILGYL